MLHESRRAFPTCVQYVPGCDHHLVIGNVAGEISLLDARTPGESVAVDLSFQEQVHRIAFSSQDNSKTFAACADSRTVKVYDVKEDSSMIMRWVVILRSL